ncbi:MAG: FKBP-type peptidyl-prolyl cis-trans isomerase [Bacteroidales bacterium]|nr:FKBP-type peptidyl-prolyl cis-trans isomerase [Bacteroidales bacterium]
MKKRLLIFATIITMLPSLLSCQNQQEINTNVKLTNDVDTVSYYIGLNMGQSIYSDFKEMNLSAFMAGVKTAINHDTAVLNKMNPDAIQIYVQKYFMKAQQIMAEENLAKAEEFLAANKTKEGVITTESGLQYKVIKEGDGKQFPTKEDQVECLYRGTLIDGTEFDGTDLRGNQPATFPIDGVIPGWTEMLQLMSLGEKVEVYIHPNLAYGVRGGGAIPPNSALIFEVELLQIIKSQPKE